MKPIYVIVTEGAENESADVMELFIFHSNEQAETFCTKNTYVMSDYWIRAVIIEENKPQII